MTTKKKPAPAALARPPLTQPLHFEPLFMERVWGGRRLEVLYGKKLPPGERVGESWEIVDRPEAQSVVHDGPLRGDTLHELWISPRRAEIFGADLPESERFPLLVKILDAQDRLSIQVHPPADRAAELGGEAKTEMWYVVHADSGAELYAGLADPGVTREKFEAALHQGNAAALVHRLPVKTGDAMFIPSGRLHAISAGNFIIEIQQNSDTTYRVFDWNRLGLDGSPRALHIAESLQSIRFDDVRPALQPDPGPAGGVLAECPWFRVEKWPLPAAGRKGSRARAALENTVGRCAIFTVLSGRVECASAVYAPGEFFLVPACLGEAATVSAVSGDALVLRTTLP
jgi:mannose-6-phosphate isomerase